MKRYAFLILVAFSTIFGCSRASVPESVQGFQNVPAQTEQTQNDAEPSKTGDNSMVQKLEMTIDQFGHETDRFMTKSGKEVAFHAIMHGSIWFEYDGLQFQIDPVSKLGDSEIDYSKYPKADYILITHEHFDHLDPAAVKKLQKDNTSIITNENSAAKLEKVEVMHNGDKKALRDDIQIEAVPAYNTTDGHEKFHPKGRDNGFIMTIDGLRIYISGDTEDIPEMSDYKDIDIAFMACNQPYTMTLAQLRHAADMVNPKVLFPYHYSETSMDEVKNAMGDKSIDLRIRKYQ